MGVIRTQSIKSGIYTYFGVFLGFANNTILLPKLLNTGQIGLISLVNSLASLFVAFCSLGVPLITIKMFPLFRDGKNNHYFFSFTFLMTIVGGILGSAVYLLLQNVILSDKNAAKDFTPFVYGFILLFTAKLISRNMDAFNRMLYKTVLGAFLDNFLVKFLIAGLLVLFWYVHGFDFKLFFLFYATLLATPGLFQLGYIIYSGNFRLNLKKFWQFGEQFKSQFRKLSIFGLLGTLGSIVVLEIDKLMISNMLSIEANGIYTICFFFGLFINIPSRGLKRAAQAIVSDAWKNNNIKDINAIYRKSCINQFLISLYLFLGVWVNIDYIFAFLPSEYGAGKYVILFIGIGQLADMVTGVNSEIIASSKFYQYNTYFTGSLIILVVILNWVLIPPFGIDGAALASALAMIFVNGAKFFFLNKQLNFQPLNRLVFLTLIIGLLSLWVIKLFVPHFDNLYLGIGITGSVITIVYWGPVIWLNISEDINNMLANIYKN